jgi:hypothetical protein
MVMAEVNCADDLSRVVAEIVDNRELSLSLPMRCDAMLILVCLRDLRTRTALILS